MRKRLLFVVACITLLAACSSPKITSTPIAKQNITEQIVIVKNNSTRNGFLNAMEEWLKDNNYSYRVAPEHYKYEDNKLILEYIGFWRWDLLLYLQEAQINAYLNGKKVGESNFYVYPNNFHPNKFGDGLKRVKAMMSSLFGKVNSKEATEIIN